MKTLKHFLFGLILYLLLQYLSFTLATVFLDGKGFAGLLNILKKSGHSLVSNPMEFIVMWVYYLLLIPTLTFFNLISLWLSYSLRYRKQWSVMKSTIFASLSIFACGLIMYSVFYLPFYIYSVQKGVSIKNLETQGLTYIWTIFSPKVFVGMLISQLLLMPVYLWGMDLIRENVKQSRGSSELEA